MFRIRCCLLSACLIAGSCLHADINTADILKARPNAPTVKENLRIIIPDDQQSQWVLGNEEVAPSGNWIMEWVPKGETVDNWSQLIQIQFFAASNFSSPIDAAIFSAAFIEQIKQVDPSVKVTELAKKNTDDILIEWTLAAANDKEDELARFISTKEGLYRLAFTQKVADIEPAVKNTWKNRLAEAQIVPASNAAPQLISK